MEKNPTALRHVAIGAGAGIFKSHRLALAEHKANLVAIADINPEAVQQIADELDCKAYTNHKAMLAEMQPDVAIVLTPHPFHAAIAIDCLDAGCHVLVEKPIAVQVAEADAMIEAAELNGRLLAVNFQQRLRPEIRAVHRLIQEEALGQLQHFHMTATWPRTLSYFQFAGWRGTWKGEGGGLLMNQAPHNLDLICHLMGFPERVVAWTKTTLHDIETEDTAEAMLAWPNGAMGSMHISTAESGNPFHIEIIGTKGILRLNMDGLHFQQFERDIRDHIANSDQKYQGPAMNSVPVVLESGEGNHVEIYQNLYDAIFDGAALTASGVEARMSLELANAMIYASYTDSAVQLPLDRQKYAELLANLQAGKK